VIDVVGLHCSDDVSIVDLFPADRNRLDQFKQIFGGLGIIVADSKVALEIANPLDYRSNWHRLWSICLYPRLLDNIFSDDLPADPQNHTLLLQQP